MPFMTLFSNQLLGSFALRDFLLTFQWIFLVQEVIRGMFVVYKLMHKITSTSAKTLGNDANFWGALAKPIMVLNNFYEI